ncbi:protein-disulfide reductase DsbD [Sulfurimonas sp.]|uniref:protein-disulfide reductase DsbD n=1 Tax=Sulfurimonas sp. TaxID=2022749 RepID=UPI0025CD7472|nr:protein-disulfide reductase DsbD [Sulfurimonas sp.]
MAFCSSSDSASINITQNKNSFDLTILLEDKSYILEESLNIAVTGDEVAISSIFYPDSTRYKEQDVFFDDVNIRANLEGNSDKEFKIVLSYQICSEECSELKTFQKEYRLFKEEAPMDKNSLSSLEQKDIISEQDAIANMLQNSGAILTLATFFGFGLLLAFTPCMLPVIPILSAVIISKKESISIKQGFLISLTYVVSMSVVYALAGVLAASLGSNIQAFFQQTWIIVTVSSLFFLLSLAMFGTFTVQMPKKIQSFLNNRALVGRDKSYYSIVVLGVLSALIVGPCVAPPLAGALIYIGQSGNELLGGLSLFFMSFGMGVPLLMLGAGAGKFLPKPGVWMEEVKLFFGFTMIAFSIWLLSRILEPQTILLLWGVQLVAVAIFMNPFDNIKSVDISRMQQLKKLLSMLALIYGVVLIVGAIGGAKSIKSPLEPFVSSKRVLSTASEVTFKTINAKELSSVLQQASKPIMVYFSAKWCENCEELDADVLSRADVALEVEEFERIKVDVSENTDFDIAMLKKYSLFGPPGIIFFDMDKQELKNYRLSGYKEKDLFIEHIRKVKRVL